MNELLAGANLALAAVLILAALSKLRNVSLFAEQIANYETIPYRLTRYTAVAVICLELATGCLLLLPRTHLLGAIFASVLFGIFLGVLIIALLRGKNIPCACFGSLSEKEPIGASSIFRTSSLFVLALIETTVAPGPSSLPIDLVIGALLMVLIFLSSQGIYLLTDIRHMNNRLIQALKDSAPAGKFQ